MDGGTAFTLCTALVFLSPVAIVGTVLRHREKMAAIKHKHKEAPDMTEEVRALRRELSDLRETTTRFDMSFDAAMNRVEQRLDKADAQDQPSNYSTYAGSVATVVEEETVLRRR